MPKQQAQPALALLRLPAVISRVGFSRSVLYQKIAAKEFPAPFPLYEGARSVGWDARAIEAYLAERIARGPRTRDERLAHCPRARSNAAADSLGAALAAGRFKETA